MAALTDLQVYCYPGGEAHQFDVIGRCTQLRSLSLLTSQFSDEQLIAFLAAPVMRQPRHLDVRDISVGNIDTDVFGASFSQMSELQSLRLDDVGGVDVLLSQLHRAPALRQFALRSRRLDPYEDMYARSTHPTVAVYAALRAAAPNLHIRRGLVPTCLW
jgi:hypothetical protein